MTCKDWQVSGLLGVEEVREGGLVAELFMLCLVQWISLCSALQCFTLR